jgi:hypothetical protein
VSLRDAIGTRIKWSTGFKETKLPTLNIGASYSPELPVKWTKLTLVVDLETSLKMLPGLLILEG